MTAWCLILKYGACYLKQVIAACDPCVDRIFVLYAKKGSQGYHTDMPCPDTEDELRACFDGVKDRVTWVSGDWPFEGAHRTAGYDMAVAAGADLVLQHDADEVFEPTDLNRCIEEAKAQPMRNVGVAGFRHLWRSFAWEATDVWEPIRFIKPTGKPGPSATVRGTVWHMSYAEPENVVAYKLQVSGHKREFRKGWFEDKFLAFAKEDIHPTCVNWWNAKPVDAAALPVLLRSHPNFGKEIVR